MTSAIALSVLSSLSFGVALITGRMGLRSLGARSGAAISIPTATVLYALAAPLAFDADGWTARAAMWFSLVGVFFPAIVTILTFRSNEVLGPTVTAALSGTAPLFALPAAALLLGEVIPMQAAIASLGTGIGVALISWRQGTVRPGFSPWLLLWPLSGAMIRGFAQAAAKTGLLLWPNPFAAGLIGYVVSSAVVIGATQVGRSTQPKPSRYGIAWFALTGTLNGSAVLLMYAALNIAPASLVAPMVATYPLVTMVVNAAFLREEPVTRRMLAGALLTVLAIVYLVGSR